MLAPAAALNQVMWNGAGVIGPALGGIIVGSHLGLRWAYAIDVASYVVAIGFALMLRPQLPSRDPDEEWEGGWKAVSAGFRFLKGRSVLQSTFTIDVVAMVSECRGCCFRRSRRRSSTGDRKRSDGCSARSASARSWARSRRGGWPGSVVRVSRSSSR